ncbi:uncharacterized protein TNCV_1426991 [Trichonephila clavipes]|nr:uncharacterized protein TNCV_1426991 [Trichonephila clavipes]
MSFRVGNRRPRIGSLILGMRSKSQGQIKFTVTFPRTFSSENVCFEHVKTIAYRPQSNRTDRVNRDLLQLIASYVNDNHETWNHFLREFPYTIRTAVNEAIGKNPADMFLGRKLITPFQKVVMVSDETEFVVGDIEKLFDEARRNTRAKYEKWEKCYNRRRRDDRIRISAWKESPEKQQCQYKILAGTICGPGEQKELSPDHPVSRGKNKGDQSDPEEEEINSTNPTIRIKDASSSKFARVIRRLREDGQTRIVTGLSSRFHLTGLLGSYDESDIEIAVLPDARELTDEDEGDENEVNTGKTIVKDVPGILGIAGVPVTPPPSELFEQFYSSEVYDPIVRGTMPHAADVINEQDFLIVADKKYVCL